jgi:hypothetical protein
MGDGPSPEAARPVGTFAGVGNVGILAHMSTDRRVINVPKPEHDFIVKRVSELLTEQGLALAGWDVRRLMAFAYGQGCEDALVALEARGVYLSPLDEPRS